MTPAARERRASTANAVAAGAALVAAIAVAAAVPFARAQEPPPPTPAEPAPATIEPPAAGEPTPALRVLKSGGLKVETAALIMSGQEGGRVQLGVLPLVVPGTGERARVPVLVEIDGSALLGSPVPEGLPLRFEVAIYALGAGGSVGGSLIQTVEVDLGRLGDEVLRSGVKLEGELALLPGDYSLRTLVRALHSPDMGLRIVPLTVPAAGGPLLAPPLFAERPDAWLAARSAGAGRSAIALAGGAPPAARPIVSLGEEVAFELPAAGFGDLGGGGLSGLRLELAQRSGEKVADLPVRIAGDAAGSIPGLTAVRASIQPRDVQAGEYLVRAVVAGPAGEVRSVAPTSVIVADGGTGGRVWAEFTGPRPAAPTATAAAPTTNDAPPARRRRIDKKPIAAAWRAALARLAGGDEPGARAAVAEIEGPLFTGADALLPEDLSAIELDVARELAAAQPDGLVPVLMLYERLYLDYRERRWFLATAHAWEMVFHLVDLYVDASRGAEPARRLAASFLVGLAKELVEVGPAGFRERAFTRALEIDPNNEVARLGLAVDAERHGEYRDATGHLERLLAGRPDHAEARLRLGVNLARLGRQREARRLFEETIAAAGDGWPVTLAYQELARLHMVEDRAADARRVLEAGLERLPDDEKLLLELALLAERRGDPAGAQSALDRVVARGGSGGSARHRYNQLPIALIEETWREIEATAEARRPSLANAMGVRAGQETSP